MTTTSNRDSHFFVAGFNCHMHRKDANVIFKEAAATAPAAAPGPTPSGWLLVPATPTREWIAAVADDGYEDCNCAQLIASILSHAPAAFAPEVPTATHGDGWSAGNDKTDVDDILGNFAYRVSPQGNMVLVLARLELSLERLAREVAPQVPAAPAEPSGLAKACEAVIAEWSRQKGLFPVLSRDGWMDDRIAELRLAIQAAPAAPGSVMGDMATLVKQLVQNLRKAAPDNDLADKALDYLERHGLLGSPLRVHSDDAAVDRFAAALKAKLAAARAKGRGGWKDCHPERLSRMLREHVEKGDPRDVANFCMFLWCLDQPISAAPATPAVDAETVQRAARYSWLREQHWHDSGIAVVRQPKQAIKPGYDCPSGARLDEFCDAGISAQAAAKGASHD